MVKTEYMTISEASEKWGLSPRQVQHLCTLGTVESAVRFGRAWMIPKDTLKPIDKQKNVSSALTPRQREICRLASFGFSDAEIAKKTYLSLSTIKKEIHLAKNKTGTEKRDELGAFV